MKDLRCYTMHYYFKIIGAEFFGGKDGYVSLTFDEATKKLELEDDMRMGNVFKADYALAFNVELKNVVRISRDEYKENVDENDE